MAGKRIRPGEEVARQQAKPARVSRSDSMRATGAKVATPGAAATVRRTMMNDRATTGAKTVRAPRRP